MDGSQGASGAPAPFLLKTYEMVDDPVTNSVVSWSQSGQSFVVWNPPEFARDLLPKYFKHNNFSSFIRQLNTYGFRKIDPDQWEFANEEFIRGQRQLLKNIHRRKPIHSHSAQGNAAVPLSDPEKEVFEKEIEKLKSDNSLLQAELERHKEENQAYEVGMKSLRQRLLDIDQRQRQLITFLAQLLKKPEFTSGVMQQSGNHNKKRRLLVSNYLNDEANRGDNQITAFREDQSNGPSTLEVFEKLDSSIGFWENFLQEVNQTRVEDDFSMLPQPSPVMISEAHASSGDSDMNMQSCSPPSHHSSSPSREIHSSPDLARNSNCADSPATSSIYVSVDSRTKSSGIDVNSSPDNILDVDASKDRVEGRSSQPVTNGQNDVFWQQFLTETPGSSVVQEGQSERREIECRRSRLEDHPRLWWNVNNVDSLSKQMGHLTPAEKT